MLLALFPALQKRLRFCVAWFDRPPEPSLATAALADCDCWMFLLLITLEPLCAASPDSHTNRAKTRKETFSLMHSRLWVTDSKVERLQARCRAKKTLRRR